MLVFRKLVCREARSPRPPRPGRCKPALLRRDGDRPTPFMLGEGLEGEFLELGATGGFEVGPFRGFLFRPDIIKHQLLLLVAIAPLELLALAFER